MNWIEAYITAVITNLPESEREEVAAELRSDIFDMLPDDAREADIKAVLTEFGPPDKLADQYRQSPNYLIGPSVYGDYLRTLKKILPLVVVVALIVGSILGGIAGLEAEADLAELISEISGHALDFAIQFSIQAVIWTTIGYIIIERTGQEKTRKETWRVEDLPQPKKQRKISVSDSITEVVFTLLFLGLALYFLLNRSLISSEGISLPLFSDNFLQWGIPVVIVTVALELWEAVTKLMAGRYTRLVVGAVFLNNLITVPMWCWLLLRGDIFSSKFVAWLQEKEWATGDLLHYISTGELRPIILWLCLIILVIGIWECGHALYRLNKDTAA